MKETIEVGSWMVVPRPNPRARLRLFCFPYGGGGASIFRTWPQNLPETVEACAVQLPGREKRFLEAPFTDLRLVVHKLAEVLPPYLTGPFAFFGHSLGAFISFELARQLRRNNLNGLIHLFVSGQRAPQIPDADPQLYQLPDDEFIKQMHRRYEGTPLEVLQNTEMMKLLLPLLRADFTMSDTYTYMEDTPLDCPITAFGGLQDREASHNDLIAWRDQTRRSFSLKMFPGGHFFLKSAQIPLLRAIGIGLKQSLY